MDGADAEGVLRVRVRAAPADGAANKALIRTLAAELGVAPSRLEIVAGTASRSKRVAVEIGSSDIRARWPGLLTRQV